MRKDNALTSLSAAYVSQQILAGLGYWQRADSESTHFGLQGIHLTGDWDPTKNLRLIAGISNLTDAKYYNRVFANGIEPAPRLSGYAGISLSF